MGVGRKQIIPGAGCSLHWIELLLRPDNPVFSTGGELAAFLHLVHATHQTLHLEHLVSLVSPVQVAAPGFILHTPQRKRVRTGAKNHTALSHAIVKITPAYSSVSSVKRPSDNSSSELKCWSQLWQRVKLVRCLQPQPAWRSSPTAGPSLFWGGGWQGRRGGQKGWKSPKLMPSSIHSRYSFLILSVISTDK